MPFEACFDAILIAEVIEHVAHPDELLGKAAAFVKPGGHVIMTTPNGGYCRNRLPRFTQCADPAAFEPYQFRPDADGHIFLLHLDEVGVIAQRAGLSVIDVRLFTNSLTNGHLKLEPLLRVVPQVWVRSLERLTCSLPLVLRKRLHTGMAVLLQRPA